MDWKDHANEEKPAPPFPAQKITPPGLETKMQPPPQFEAPAYQGSGKLRDKVALITGGDSGIGKAVAVLFAREMADIAFTYLPEENADAEDVLEHIACEGQQSLGIPGNLSDRAAAELAVKKTVDRFGKLDILVNNAAYQRHVPQLEDLSDAQWDWTFKINIYSYFRMVKAALPYLKNGSVIINTGSVTGLEGSAHLIDYASTKGAIHAFSKSLAQALLPRGIRVNCVAPGPVWTPLNPAERSSEETRHFGEHTPLGRPAQPEEIAPTYVFLASNADSSYMSGEIIALLGGQTRAD